MINDQNVGVNIQGRLCEEAGDNYQLNNKVEKQKKTTGIKGQSNCIGCEKIKERLEKKDDFFFDILSNDEEEIAKRASLTKTTSDSKGKGKNKMVKRWRFMHIENVKNTTQ